MYTGSVYFWCSHILKMMNRVSYIKFSSCVHDSTVLGVVHVQSGMCVLDVAADHHRTCALLIVVRVPCVSAIV